MIDTYTYQKSYTMIIFEVNIHFGKGAEVGTGTICVDWSGALVVEVAIATSYDNTLASLDGVNGLDVCVDTELDG